MPTHVTRQGVISSRAHESMDQSRRREMVCNMLTQIFVLAERTRASKRRSVPDEETEPISLIELIQASYSVFERYGIGPPDDAVYHRYLLSLSINPERNWRKKIWNFDLETQPQVKRLCTTVGHRHGAATATQTDDIVPEADTSGIQRRQRTRSKENLVRRASLSKPSTPMRNPTPNSGNAYQHQHDRFGDMLSLDSPIQRVHVSGRSAFLKTKSSTSPQGRVVPFPQGNKQSKNQDTLRGKDLTKDSDQIAVGERQLHMLTTSIEQWRATQAVKQLVDQNKLQDQQSRKQQILTRCTYAIFHWVTLCLPEKIDFHETESPRALPLCILRRISVNVKVLKKSAQRVWMWRMKTLLKTWHHNAHKLKTFCVHMMIKQRASVLDTVFQCIQSWRLFTETKKCCKDRAQWVSQRCSRSRLRSCLKHWRRRFHSRRQQHQVDRHHRSRVKRKVLKLWQQTVELTLDNRVRFEMARKRRVFQCWKREKERQQAARALLCMSNDQRKLRVLSDSWNKLRANVSRNQTAQTRMSLWEIASKQRKRREFLRYWKMAIDERKDFRERAERFHRYSRRRHLSQTFAAWAGWTERQGIVATMLEDTTEARIFKHISTCFATWKKHIEKVSSTDDELVARVIRLRRQIIWQQWRKSTGTRSATRFLDSAYSLHLQTKVFTRWKLHTSKKVELHFTLLECQQKHRFNVLALHWKFLVANMRTQHHKQLAAENFEAGKVRELKRVCLSKWQLHVREKRACRIRGEQVRNSMRRHRLIYSTWTIWRQTFWLRNVVRLADDQLHSYRKSRALRMWQKFVRAAHKRRDRALKVVEMLGNFHLNACFRQWKQLVVSKHQLGIRSALVQEKICKRLLSSRWKTWRFALKSKRGQHEKLSAVTSRWQNRQLYASFYSWKTTWSIRKRHRRLLQTTLLTSKQRVLETHFNAWRKRCNASGAREHYIAEAQNKLLRFKVKRAIRCWNSLRLKHHENNVLLVKSLALWRQTLLSSAFKRLKQHKQRHKHKKTLIQLVLSFYRKKSMLRVFTSWSTWARSKEQMVVHFEAATHRLDALKMMRTIQRLKDNSHLRKRLRTVHVGIVAMSSGHANIAAFSRWKTFIAQKHCNQREIAAQVASMKKFRVRRRIQRWKTYVKTRKLLKTTLARAVTASTTSLLQQNFVNWKKFVTQQTFTKALKQKATAFRYFCLLPLYFRAWKTFVSAKNHRQELLLRARGLWSHQTESRAFKTWVQFVVNNQQTKHAVAKWKNLTIARSFVSWKRFESLQKKKQRDQIRAVIFYERRICRRVLKEWRVTSRHDRLARSCAKLWYQNTSRRAFDTWIHHARILQSSRHFLLKIRYQTLARVFTAWKERIKQKTQQLEDIQERFTLFWMIDARQSGFTRWKRYAHLRSFIRKKFGEKREILLENVVKQWRRVVVSRQRSRQSYGLVAERVKLNFMRMIWSNWRTKAQLLRYVKALRGKVTENRVTSDLRQRIHRWKQFTVLSIAVKTFVGRQDLELMRMVFVDGFQRFAQLKRKERDLVKQIGCVHEAYMKEWLARKLQQRMSILAACEDIRRSRSSKRLLSTAWREWMSFHLRKQALQASLYQFQVQISHLEDQDCHLDKTELVGMLRRWKTIDLARVFERWNEATKTQQHVRLHTRKAIEWWHKIHCGKYFQGWKRFCQQQRKQRRIRTMNVKSKLKRTWKLWQVFKIASKSKKVLNQSVRQFHVVHIYRNSLKLWREAANSLRLRREQILEIYHSSRLRLLAALLEEWRKFAAMEKTKRMQITVARVVFEQKLMRIIFTEWTVNVAGICHHRRQLQVNTERLQVLLLCSAFRAWNSWSKQHKKLKTVMQVLSTKCDVKAASRVFKAWHLHAEKIARLRHQTLSFLRFRRMQKGVKALQSLAHEQVYLRTICQKAKLFSSTLSGNQVAMIFSRWRKFTTLSRKTRIVTLRYLQNKLLPAAWNAWVVYVKSKCEAKDKILTATLSWKNTLLRKVWNALILVHSVEKERHEMLSHADFHYYSRRLRKTFAFWWQSSKQSQHFRTVCGKQLSRWRMQTAFRCFCSLRDHAVYSSTLRTSENIVRSKVRATAMLKAWYSWRKLILILRSGKRRVLQCYWTAWIRSQEFGKVLQRFQEQIQSKVLRSTQRRYMENWKQFVATNKIEKAMMLMSTAFAGTQLLKRVWLCWMKYVAQTRTAKSRMKNALVHMHLQLQFKAFRAFQVHTSLQKWKTHANIRVLAFRSHRLNSRYFFEWKAMVIDQISRRRKLVYYVNVMQHSVQKKSFGAWYSFVTRRKSLRLKVSLSLAMRTQLCSRMVFQTWKSFVAKVHRNRLAQGFRTAKVSAQMVKHWKRYVVLCKIERMIGTNELRLVESNFLSWRKSLVATHRIRAFRAKSARKHWLQLVGRIFTSWKQRSQTHIHCRKLLASVAVGNHLRFRFMLWQKFTVHRKRLVSLLLVVANPPTILPLDTQIIGHEDGNREIDNKNGIIEEGEQGDGLFNNSLLNAFGDSQENYSSTSERELASLGQALAKKARVLQRFEVTWDLPHTWHRWRQIFHAQLFYRIRRLQFHFINWQRFAHQQRRSRFIVMKRTNQRQATSAQTIFRAWAELVARVKQLQKDRLRERELWVLVNTEMVRRERRQLKKHWHAWKFHIEETRHLQASLDAYHRARLLTKFWLVWCHDYRQIMSEARCETQRVDAHMQKFLLRRALKSLQIHQQRSKRARLVLEYFGNRRYDTLLPEVLTRWRKWCQRQKEVACHLETARANKTRRHFTAWKMLKNTQKWQRIVVNSFQSKSVEQQRRDVWMRWRKYVKKRVAKDLALQKAAIFHVCLRLRKRWLRCTQRAIQLHEKTEIAHVKLCVFRGHRAVNRWREFSRTRRLRRLYQQFVLRKHVLKWQSVVKHAMATRFDEFLLRSKTKKMLIAWKQVAVKHQYWRKLCTFFVEKKEMQTTQRGFLRWQRFINARQGKRLASMHAEQKLLKKVWRCWDRATFASQLRRHEQLEQAAEHKAFTLLRQSMSVWQATVKNQRERRFVLLACVIKLESVAGQRVQEIVFRAWKRVVDLEHRCGAALLKRDCNTIKCTLSCWLVWTRDQQRRRQQLESAANYHSQRLKSAVFFYWQTYALAWQDAAKPIVRRHNREMSLPARIVSEPRSTDSCEGSEDSDADVRRPLSPVLKRIRDKKTNRTRPAEDVNDSSDMVTLPEAVEISMDVKKRLILLGKWKPQQNAKSKSKLRSSST